MAYICTVLPHHICCKKSFIKLSAKISALHHNKNISIQVCLYICFCKIIYMITLAAGMKAPAFKGKDQNDKTVSLI